MKNNVLIFPSGAENALEVNEAIKNSIHINVIPASSKKDYSGLIYENDVEFLPYINDVSFIDELNKLIEKKNIDLIFPTHDTAALFLTQNSDKIKAKIVSSDIYTNRVARYKKLTYELFKNEDFNPSIYLNPLELVEEKFPIFAKPDVGQGGQGAKVIKERKMLDTYEYNDDIIFLEYLPGREYTIDCFSDRKGELLFSGVRERAEVKMGITFRSVEHKLTTEIKNIAKTINSKLNFRGLWFFQLKEDKNGKLKLLEISTRIAGTMGFFRHLGVNLPMLSIFDALGHDVEIKKSNFNIQLYRTTVNRYEYDFTYNNIYVDFDDTLIVNNKVNIDLIAYLYHCKNLRKKIHLITKHEYDIYQTLNKYNLQASLFDSIIVLKLEDNKSDHINPNSSIFIDNWYKERKEVSSKLNIPTFDVDVIKSLIIK